MNNPNNPDRNKQPIPDPTPDKQEPGKENPTPVQPPPDKPEVEPIPQEIPDRDTPHTPANPQATGEREEAFKKQSPDKH